MFQRCLRSLLQQKVQDAPIDLHLLIVDNSAAGAEREVVVKQRQSASLPLSYVHQPTPGIPNARNAALNAIETLSPDWIAFIDDDEIAPSDWIARLHAVALHSGADVASGKVVQFPTSYEAQSGAENWQVPSSFGEVRRRLTCPTSNVIFRASYVLGNAGLRFDESMRHGGSDVEFFMRAGQKGARIFHVKDAVVFEEYPSERKTLAYESKRAFRVGTTTNYRYRKNYGGIPGTALLAARVLAKTATAIASATAGLVIFPFNRVAGERYLLRSARAAATAFGFIGPVLGITPTSYW
jgi:glycosyltransferase involved in cell wall biosynthesis